MKYVLDVVRHEYIFRRFFDDQRLAFFNASSGIKGMFIVQDF